MDLYQKLVVYYDDLFPFDQKKYYWLMRKMAMSPGDRVLDLGCGTGQYVTAFALDGYEAYGLDSDPAMIERARQKIHQAQFRNAYVAKGDITKDYPFDKMFDGMMCIGNTLPHLNHEDQVTQGLKLARQSLIQGGKLIIQVVNFDAPDICHKIFPVLHARDGTIKFYRSYHASPDHNEKLVFATRIEVFEGEQSSEYRHDGELLILTKEKIARSLLDAGFGHFEFVNGFSDEPWDPLGNATVVVAEKK